MTIASTEAVLAEAAAAGSGEYVLLGLPDVHGQIRGKALRPAAFEAAMRDGAVMTDLLLGLDTTDTPISDYETFGIRAGAGDLVVRPDTDTLRELSWLPGWRVCLCTPEWADGRPCELSSRETLRRVLASTGHETLAAIEYELRLRDGDGRPLSSGISYALGEIAGFEAFLERLGPALESLGVELSAVHTEAGPGLLELNVAARPGLRAADDAAYVKLAVKEVARSLGLRASFLAKTEPGEEGSSGHVHLSFWDGDGNACASGEVLDAAIAGVLEHLPAASALLNPTINSYKRLVPGWFAPTNASWGEENRSCAVRAIRGQGKPARARLECRRPGADANPYLAIAALAASAADGMRRGLTPPEPVIGDAYAREDLPPLPTSLECAIAAFEADGVLREALGETFSDYYLVSRRWELKAWQEAVSDWERARYGDAV